MGPLAESIINPKHGYVVFRRRMQISFIFRDRAEAVAWCMNRHNKNELRIIKV